MLHDLDRPYRSLVRISASGRVPSVRHQDAKYGWSMGMAASTTRRSTSREKLLAAGRPPVGRRASVWHLRLRPGGL